jgi:hypothetical protein
MFLFVDSLSRPFFLKLCCELYPKFLATQLRQKDTLVARISAARSHPAARDPARWTEVLVARPVPIPAPRSHPRAARPLCSAAWCELRPLSACAPLPGAGRCASSAPWAVAASCAPPPGEVRPASSNSLSGGVLRAARQEEIAVRRRAPAGRLGCPQPPWSSPQAGRWRHGRRCQAPRGRPAGARV